MHLIMGSKQISAGDRANTFYSSEYMEFTLAIGCPVNCHRYCPQEVLLQNYGKATRRMTLESFKKMLANVPSRIAIDFSGFCEPAVNPQFSEMVKYAYDQGYRVHVATTLQGASSQTVKDLLDIHYEGFVLHLPDGKNANMQLTEEYKNNVFQVMQGIANIQYITMNELFVSNQREKICRGELPKAKRLGVCRKTSTPQFVVLPDGRVQTCDMDFKLEHTVGNLLTDKYEALVKRFRAEQRTYELCHYCTKYYPIDKYLVYNVANRLGYFNRGKWM
jgi:sulfatase maturation enzyme AslB (radical SAM superfamily)